MADVVRNPCWNVGQIESGRWNVHGHSVFDSVLLKVTNVSEHRAGAKNLTRGNGFTIIDLHLVNDERAFVAANDECLA